MGDEPRVLIVGAGIAGLALTAVLQRVGITPVVVEAAKASLSRGLALMLTSNLSSVARVQINYETTVVADRGAGDAPQPGARARWGRGLTRGG